MAHLVRIGNSHGTRIPKATIEQAHLEGKNMKLQVVKGGLLVSPNKKAREGWEEAIKTSLTTHGKGPLDSEWLDAPLISENE